MFLELPIFFGRFLGRPMGTHMLVDPRFCFGQFFGAHSIAPEAQKLCRHTEIRCSRCPCDGEGVVVVLLASRETKEPAAGVNVFLQDPHSTKQEGSLSKLCLGQELEHVGSQHKDCIQVQCLNKGIWPPRTIEE